MAERITDFAEANKTKPRSFVFMMIKPLGMDPSVYCDIRQRISQRGVIAIQQQMIVERDKIEQHYEGIKYLKDGSLAPHFYPITSYLVGQRVEALVVEDFMGHLPEVFVSSMRDIVGKSNPLETRPDQIRHLALDHVLPYHRVVVPEVEGSNFYCRDNLVHCSDSIDAAMREVSIWMPEQTVQVYQQVYDAIKKQ